MSNISNVLINLGEEDIEEDTTDPLYYGGFSNIVVKFKTPNNLPIPIYSII